MAENDLQPGAIYERGGEEFIIVQSSGLTMKDADAATWKAAVSYRRSDRTEPLMVRAQDDFLEKHSLKTGASA